MSFYTCILRQLIFFSSCFFVLYKFLLQNGRFHKVAFILWHSTFLSHKIFLFVEQILQQQPLHQHHPTWIQHAQ